MDINRLKEILEEITNLSILVVGDYFLDKYLIIDPDLGEKSLETGLDAHQVIEKRLSPGAAGTVVNNLRALGWKNITALGFTGDDGDGFELIKSLKNIGVNTDEMYKTPIRFTPVYTKPMVREGTLLRELNRLDIKNRLPLPSQVEDHILIRLGHISHNVDAIMVLDQVSEGGCGVITERVREELALIGRRKGSPVIYADSRENTRFFNDIIVKCNREELLRAFNHDRSRGVRDDDLINYGKKLFEKNRRPVFVTLGGKGQLVFDSGSVLHIPGVGVKGPLDICGAGDAASSGIVSALCCNVSPGDAALLGNIVASITIQQLGTTGTARPDQIISRFNEIGNKQ